MLSLTQLALGFHGLITHSIKTMTDFIIAAFIFAAFLDLDLIMEEIPFVKRLEHTISKAIYITKAVIIALLFLLIITTTVFFGMAKYLIHTEGTTMLMEIKEKLNNNK